MKFSSLKIWSRIIVVVFLCCVLVLLQVSMVNLINAQLNCPPASTPLYDTNDREHWASNVTVQVNVNSGLRQFTSSEFNNCVKPAFNNFNSANSPTTSLGNSSRVNFSVTFSQNAVAQIVTTSQISSNIGVSRGFQINRGNLNSSGNPNEFTGGITYRGDDGFYRNSATTVIDTHITNCSALTNAVAHEIGHTMGLEHDCGITGVHCPA